MNYHTYLKRNRLTDDKRWIVKYSSDGLIKEVKLIYNVDEYRKIIGRKALHTQDELIKLLDENKERKAK